MGTILSNLLLVLGTACVVACVRSNTCFAGETARVSTALLILSVVSILIPGQCHCQYPLARKLTARSSGIFHLAMGSPPSPGISGRLTNNHLKDELSMSRGVSPM